MVRAWFLLLTAVLFLSGCHKRELEDRSFPSVVLIEDGQIEEKMQQEQQKSNVYLDYGHVKAVLIDETVLLDREALKEVLLYLEEQPIFARNMLVFCADKQVQESAKIQEKTIGKKLQNLYKNNDKEQQEKGITLQDILNYLHNMEAEIIIPKLIDEDGDLYIEGELILQM